VAAFSGTSVLPVRPSPLACTPIPAQPNIENAAATIASIEQAMKDVQAGDASAICTLPLAKSVLQAAGFSHPGHTEFLGALCGNAQKPMMMLAVPGLRVVLATIHQPLASVSVTLSQSRVEDIAQRTLQALTQDFGITAPRLAVAAFNPHGGEDGTLGREEIEIIAPACAALRAAGLAVSGPHPADTLFHAAARETYDAALCMYHDQALIPLKTIDFARGVNITLGLPIVRTSPDHGTAFDIAGKGIADPRSLIEALNTAYAIAGQRRNG
ncbi:MAG: 4-hydroxythreonine-4-phosphate dehydrogenase PdxA, partial [Alphaproteobacteria bacterium]